MSIYHQHQLKQKVNKNQNRQAR